MHKRTIVRLPESQCIVMEISTFIGHCFQSLVFLRHTVILEYFNITSAPKTKINFQFLWGILEGHPNRDRPSQPILKNCQNCTFLPTDEIWNFFGPNDFIWGAMLVPLIDFIQKMSQAPSSSVHVLIWEDKLDYLKNPPQDFKNSFCLWFLWISSNAGRQN